MTSPCTQHSVDDMELVRLPAIEQRLTDIESYLFVRDPDNLDLARKLADNPLADAGVRMQAQYTVRFAPRESEETRGGSMAAGGALAACQPEPL